MRSGLFITFEGIDGVGKTTQVKLLANVLKEKGYPIYLTREPGGTRLGQLIRNLLLDPEMSEISHQTEILLYAADRAQHVQEVIKPELAAGKIVICDRYLDSSIAYQGYGLGWDIDLIKNINQAAIAGFVPDITICLDLDPQQALAKTSGDRLESRTLEYYEQVRAGYLTIAKQEPSRFSLVKATGTRNQVHQRIWSIIKGRVS